MLNVYNFLLFRLNNSLEGLMPGEAYMPDDEDEDVPNFSTSTGNIDFAASIEKVKSVSLRGSS